MSEVLPKLDEFTDKLNAMELDALHSRVALWAASFSETQSILQTLVDIRINKGVFKNNGVIQNNELHFGNYLVIESCLMQTAIVSLHRYKATGNAFGDKVTKGHSVLGREMRTLVEGLAKEAAEAEGLSSSDYDKTVDLIQNYRDSMIAHDDAKPLYANSSELGEAFNHPQTTDNFILGSFPHRERCPRADLELITKLHTVSKLLMGASLVMMSSMERRML